MSFDLRDLLTTRTSVNHSISPYQKVDGDYYLIMVESGEVYAAKMIFSAAGGELHRAYVAAHPTKSERQNSIGGSVEQNKFEGYVLGQLASLGEQIKIGDYTAVGSAFAYGWQFNWDGSQAVCVTQTKNTVPGEFGDLLSHFTARIYMLSITEDIDGLLSASVLETESTDWQPSNGDPHVWTPDGLSMMFPWAPTGCGSIGTVPGYGGNDFDAPLHAFYKSDGALKVIRYAKEIQTTKTIAELEEEANEETCRCYGKQAAGFAFQEYEYTGWLDETSVRFYTTDGDEYKKSTSDGGYYQRALCNIYDEAGVNEQRNIMSYDLANHYCQTDAFISMGGLEAFGWKYGTGHTEFEYSDPGSPSLFNATAYPVLIFPFHSSESVYILMAQRTEIATATAIQDAPEAWGEMRQMEYIIGVGLEPITDYYPIYYPKNEIYECDPADPSAWDLQCTVNNPTVYGTIITSNTSSSRTEWELDMTLITPFETIACDSIETTDVNDLGEYLGFIQPVLCPVPVKQPAVENFQSAFGNSIRVDSLYEYPYSFESNNSVPADKTAPTGMWLGRA